MDVPAIPPVRGGAMKILLIKPPIRACMVEIGRHMPIGLAYLASVLRNDGHSVTLFDSLSYIEDNHIVDPDEYTSADRQKIAAHPRWRHLMHWGASWERLESLIMDSTPDAVGISCMFTPYYEPAYELARMVKRLRPGAHVLLGGQHPTVAHPHALAESAIDVLVLGESEQSIGGVLRSLERREPLTRVPGVAFMCGKGLCSCQPAAARAHTTGRAPWIANLDELPLPAADLVDFSRYDAAATLITSRGCPFSCSFCTVHATVGKSFRARSPNNVVDEIEHYVAAHGVRRFLIEDDNFTFDITRVRAICREVRRRDLDVELHLPNGITVINLSPDLVDEMAAAGFKSLFLGLETTDVARLRKLRKGFTSLPKVKTGTSLFAEYGVDASASLIVGLMGQTLKDIARDSINVAVSGVAFWTNPFYPIPGSGDFTRCLELGLIDRDTELALYDQFNFAIGSDQLGPARLYYAWVATQALAQWPEFVLAGARARLNAAPADPAGALARLVAESRNLPCEEGKLEVAAVPAAADGLTVTAHPGGCFCSMQRPRERAVGGGPLDFCLLTGDIIAAAVSLHSGISLSARQVSSRVADPAQNCVFELSPCSTGVQADVCKAFLDELDAESRDRDAALTG